MPANQPAQRRGAAVWRTVRRAAAALRAFNDGQVLMWEVFLQSSRIPPNRAGPLTWVPSLDGPRLTGDELSVPDAADAGHGP
jgi:hypothetical protein